MRLSIVVILFLLLAGVARAAQNPDRRNVDLRVSSPFGSSSIEWANAYILNPVLYSPFDESRLTVTGFGGEALLTLPRGAISWLIGYAYHGEKWDGKLQHYSYF